MKKATLKIAGYKETEVILFCTGEKGTVLTGFVKKETGRKPYHVTVQKFTNGTTKVFTIEQLKNIEHKNFEII